MTERTARNSFADDDEDPMEVPQIPDIELSDVDEDKDKNDNKKKSPIKNNSSSPSKAEATPGSFTICGLFRTKKVL